MHGPCRTPCAQCDAIWPPYVTYPYRIDDPIVRRLFVMNLLTEENPPCPE
jgi:hypothetical protein